MREILLLRYRNKNKQCLTAQVKLFSTEWFAHQTAFSTCIEDMTIQELNKCLSKFYVSARKKDGSHYKRNSLLSVRAAIDRYLKSPPLNKTFSICDHQFKEANSTLSAYLRNLSSSGKIAGTVHKPPLTPEVVEKLFEAGELGNVDCTDPRVLMQTVWFYTSLYLGRRGRENQSSLKKSLLRLVQTGEEEFFELNKTEPGTVFVSKNHTGGLHGTEDHSDGKIFAHPGSKRCPVQTIKSYLSHLNPGNEALFQRPRSTSSVFNPKADPTWYELRKLGHNSLENMLKTMTTRAGISPYLTNHSLRATTVTVLSASNVENRQIKAVTGHKSDTSIQSYCERPTLDQFRQMSTSLSEFVQGSCGGEEPAQAQSTISSGLDVAPAPLCEPSTSAEARKGAVTATSIEEKFVLSQGLNPGAILPSGSFQDCAFTFHIHVNNSK